MHARLSVLLLASLLTFIPPAASDDGTAKPLTCPYPSGPVVFCVTLGEQAFERDVYFVDVPDGVQVTGRLDRYVWGTAGDFTGSDLVVPCVVLIVGDDEANPCADLGLTYDSTVHYLTDNLPSPQTSSRTLRIYEATLDAMVLGFGLRDEEILTVDPCQVQQEFLGTLCPRYGDPIGGA